MLSIRLTDDKHSVLVEDLSVNDPLDRVIYKAPNFREQCFEGIQILHWKAQKAGDVNVQFIQPVSNETTTLRVADLTREISFGALRENIESFLNYSTTTRTETLAPSSHQTRSAAPSMK